MQINNASYPTRSLLPLFLVVFLLTIPACTLPSFGLETATPVYPTSSIPVETSPPEADPAPGSGVDNPTPGPNSGNMPTASDPGNGVSPALSYGNATPTGAVRPTPIATFTEPPPLAGVGNLPPADIPFTIDCSQLPARQAECEAYVTRTREVSYPNLRDLTGISLANCYTEVHYTIVPGKLAEAGHVGFADYNRISYGENSSLDWGPGNTPYDVHELIHTFDFCSGAFSGSGHLLLGMLMDAVYARLGIRAMPYYSQQEFVLQDYQDLIVESQAPIFSGIYNICEGILGDRAKLAYFAYGDLAVRRIYRSAIARAPISLPSSALDSVFGSDALAVQAIVEALEKEFGEPMNVPACGF